jgi:RNA polymerase sigma factor (sigma-70 family)
MAEHEWLAERFEENRSHLRAVAYRMLGSASEADDAVQEAWLRLSRTDTTAIENLQGWLTTVVARVCLDILRSRASRREQELDTSVSEPAVGRKTGADPEHEVLLANSLGLALLVVLDRLNPAERVAFVLHDMFGVTFEEIAAIVGRSPTATRQLASRARRRVQGPAKVSSCDLSKQRQVVDAFLTALRSRDFEGLIAVLDPDVVVRLDSVAARGGPTEIRGATTWAKGAVAFSHFARAVQPMLVNGAVGLVLAPGGRLARALTFTIVQGKITQVEIIADPARVRELDIGVLAN